MEREKYRVYAHVDASERVTAINSSAFIADTAGWVQIDEGQGDQYHHAQNNYLPGPMIDHRGAYRYKLVEGALVERTKEEMAADDVPDEQAVDFAEEIAALKQENQYLKEALDLILSGETEE